MFHMRGEALSHFKRNRIGLCVLHPIHACAGVEAQVTRKDGTSYKAIFPADISPHQPFLDIQQMHYTVENIQVHVTFEGDVFETEDQRNWTDSSYKTYSTPLHLPMPVEVKKGETLEQNVSLHVATNNVVTRSNTKHNHKIQPQKVPLPHIGFCRVPGSDLLSEPAIGLLKKLPFHHYRITLHLDDAAWMEELQRSATEAQQLETPLEVVVFFSTGADNEGRALLQQLQKINTPLFSMLLLQKGVKATPGPLLQKWYAVLKQTFSKAHIGWGTDGNFADLNRARPGDTPHDFVSFSLYPQVHASDSRSIIENLETQHHTLQTVHTFTQQPVHLSPVTFAGHHVGATDPRQRTAFAAWWTLKTLHNLSGARSITFYNCTGANGLLQQDSRSNELRPTRVYEVFAQLKAFHTTWILQTLDADPLLDAVVFENESGEQLQFVLDAMRV